MEAPEIEFHEGPAPAELVIEDITIGDGTVAAPGDKVTVHYLGVEFDSGEQNKDFSFMKIKMIIVF